MEPHLPWMESRRKTLGQLDPEEHYPSSQDLEALAALAQALWADPSIARGIITESFTAALLAEGLADRRVERTAQALLRRVRRQGMAANANSNLRIPEAGRSPFYQLGPEERFLLSALHQARWSYARLSRIFEASVEEIEGAAWRARLHLSQIGAQFGARFVYPTGAKLPGAHCPEYRTDRPWTQKFLDDEAGTSRDRLFLQTHLMACDSCRQSLERARELYYSLEALLPVPRDLEETLESLSQVSGQAYLWAAPSERSFIDTLRIFSARKDVRWVVGFFGIYLAWKIF